MEPPKIWRERRERYLGIGNNCLDCKEKSFPKANYCLKCSSKNIEEYKLARTGKILHFTQVTQPAQETIMYSPFIIGLIELDDGIKVTGQIVDYNYDDVKEGMKVRMIFRVLSIDKEEGLIKYGYKFVPY